jgi:DNA-damage-inducible protein D
MSSTDITSYEARLNDLRVVTLTDGEVWSARDLMEFAGYDRWDNFSKAITRAVRSVEASGLDAADHFRGSAKKVRIGSGSTREIEDVEVTRYGCYILFQNADGSKPEIAAAQQYFAVQTRKQELATPNLTDDEIVARALQITSQRVQQLEAKITEDAPKVAYVDEFVDRDDVVLFRVAASEIGIGEQELRDRLGSAGWIYRSLIGTRWSKSKGREVKEYEYRAASAHADKFRSMPQHNAPRHHNGQVRTTLYIRSSALPAIRRRLQSNLVAVTS